MIQTTKPPGLITPNGEEVSTKPAFPLTIDLRWGTSDEEMARMTFYLDGGVRGDIAKLRTWLSKCTTDVNPGVVLQWWMILGMLEANSDKPADVSVGGGEAPSDDEDQPAPAGGGLN